MLEKDIVAGEIGPNAKYDLKLKDGKVQIEVDFVKDAYEAGLVIKVGADAVLDLIAAAIPGHFEDGLLASAKELLK